MRQDKVPAVSCGNEIFKGVIHFGYDYRNMKNRNLFLRAQSKLMWNIDSGVDEEVDIFDLSEYSRTPKVTFGMTDEEKNIMLSSISDVHSYCIIHTYYT